MTGCCSKVSELPIIGFGTWRIPREEAADLVKKALSVGYKHIDCASCYENEDKVGETLGELQDRQSVYVTSKLWSDSHEPEQVKASCEKTLKDLQLEYLDLYLVHNPVRIKSISLNDANEFVVEGLQETTKENLLETWRAMEKTVESGKCKSIGVSNFTTKKIQYILDEGSIKPYNNQVELHPYLPQRKLLKFCNDNGIVLSAYSPLGNPGLVGSPLDQKNQVLLQDPIVQEVATAAKISPAQALIAWAVSRKTPLLVKSSSEVRMKENLLASQIKLSDEHKAALDSLEKTPSIRYLHFDMFQVPGSSLQYWDDER